MVPLLHFSQLTLSNTTLSVALCNVLDVTASLGAVVNLEKTRKKNRYKMKPDYILKLYDSPIIEKQSKL